MNVGCNERTKEGTSRLLLFLIIVPLSILSIPRAGKISVARNLIPAGSGQQSWMATERQGVRSRSFMSKYPQIEKSSQAIDMPRERLPKT